MPSHKFASRAVDGVSGIVGEPIAFVVDGELRLHKASIAGETLLNERIFLQNSFGVVDATIQMNAQRLRFAVKDVLNSGSSSAELETADGCLVMDLITLGPAVAGPALIVIAAHVRPDRGSTKLSERNLRSNLTFTERRLVSALSGGRSVPKAAHYMGIAPTTARTHLQRIFDKTGIRRQIDLLRALNGGDHLGACSSDAS